MSDLHVNGHLIDVRRPDKQLYPSGFTKAQLIDYYVRAAPVLLPHVRERPIALKRFPDGVRNAAFWEKDAPAFTPAWVEMAPVWRRSRESQIHYIVVNNRATLVWIASIAAVELHPFLHRRGD